MSKANLKRYEFTPYDLTNKAFGVYSDSSFAFYCDSKGTYHYSDNPKSEKMELGDINKVNQFLESWADIEN